MPITLSCTACAKPFRARDESAGKKVKCPYCQAPVVVPNDGAGGPPAEDAPYAPPVSRAEVALPPLPRSRPGASRADVALPPPAPKVASPDDWGTAPPVPPPPPAPAPPPAPFPLAGGAGASRPRPTPTKSPLTADQKTADEALAQGWNRARRGLGWVRLGLLFVVLLGFVEFGKAVYVAQGNKLPTGDGAAWLSIEGVINSAGNAIQLKKEQLLNLACYGPPLLLAFLCLLFGRLRAGGAPRASGARGLFALSALFTLVWFALLVGYFLVEAMMPRYSGYVRLGCVFALALAEFLFLVGVTACGLALKRPGAAKAVGLFGFLLALAGVAATIGWQLYAEFARPKAPTANELMYEAGAFAGVWLVVVLAYRNAAGVVRAAAREFVETVEDNSRA